MNAKLMAVLVGMSVWIGASAVYAQPWATTYRFVVPAERGAAAVNMAETIKQLNAYQNGEPLSTNKVPLVAQLDYRQEPDIFPRDVLYTTGDFALWKGVEIPKNTRDPLLRPFRKQRGHGLGLVVTVEGDGYYPLALSNLVTRAEIFLVPGNIDLWVKPTRFYLQGFIYPRDRDGNLRVNEEGELLKPKRVTYSNLKSLARSRVHVDSLNLFLQFADVGINASSMPASTNTEKIALATEEALNNRGTIFMYNAFIETLEDEGCFVDYDANDFFLTIPDE